MTTHREAQRLGIFRAVRNASFWRKPSSPTFHCHVKKLTVRSSLHCSPWDFLQRLTAIMLMAAWQNRAGGFGRSHTVDLRTRSRGGYRENAEGAALVKRQVSSPTLLNGFWCNSLTGTTLKSDVCLVGYWPYNATSWHGASHIKYIPVKTQTLQRLSEKFHRCGEYKNLNSYSTQHEQLCSTSVTAMSHQSLLAYIYFVGKEYL
jgi:hypothetical protein